MLRGKLKNRRSSFEEEEVNPMDGAINIVDAMLVFACGLMLSLIINWNVDLQSATQSLENKNEVKDINSTTEEVKDMVDEDATYAKMGTVYIDPETGQMFLVQEGE